MSVYFGRAKEHKIVECACGCGATFDQWGAKGRLKKCLRGHRIKTASRRNQVTVNGATATILLTRGRAATVDAQDADLAFDPWLFHHKGYAVREGAKGEPTWIGLHREVLGRKLGRRLRSEEEADHVNGNRLDNRRDNLRLADDAGSAQNAKPRTAMGGRKTVSRFKGVTKPARYTRWLAQIQANRQHRRIGVFSTEELAAYAYDEAAIELHGEFARLNFPELWDRRVLVRGREPGE